MNTEDPAAREVIGYRRSDLLPGVEILDADDSPREWRTAGWGYAITFFQTWRGVAAYRGRMHHVHPGVVFCNHPEEALIATPERGLAGSFKVLNIHSEVFRQYAAEHLQPSASADWRSIVHPVSEALTTKLHGLARLFEPSTSALELQTEAAELSELLVQELMTGEAAARGDDNERHAAARMREFLHQQEETVDLDTLAAAAGLSRFQALRAFKRHYGLPPHAYQVCLRVARARSLLLQGASAADVAAQCGFVDQSHMTRHFRRVVGVTPGHYTSRGALRQPISSEELRARAARRATEVIESSDRRRR